MTSDFKIDKEKTALVIIDLQKGIAGMPVKPHDSKTVVKNAAMLAEKFRENDMPVFPVHVNPGKNDRLNPNSDDNLGGGQEPSADWAKFVPEIRPKPSDIVITKKQWGAFYGTELDLQLRRRKIDTIVLCGIATNYGVESTARFAYEYGYNQVFAEDAMSSMSEDMHKASINYVLKKMGLVRKTDEIIAKL